jgi:hypothetical protein
MWFFVPQNDKTDSFLLCWRRKHLTSNSFLSLSCACHSSCLRMTKRTLFCHVDEGNISLVTILFYSLYGHGLQICYLGLGRRKTLFWVVKKYFFSLFIRFYRAWHLVEWTKVMYMTTIMTLIIVYLIYYVRNSWFCRNNNRFIKTFKIKYSIQILEYFFFQYRNTTFAPELKIKTNKLK